MIESPRSCNCVSKDKEETKRMLEIMSNNRQQQQQQLQDEPEAPSDMTEEELNNILAVLEGVRTRVSQLLSSPRLKAVFFLNDRLKTAPIGF
jgi:hypothetical protein